MWNSATCPMALFTWRASDNRSVLEMECSPTHTTRPAYIYIRNLGHSTFPLPQRLSDRRSSFYLQWHVCSWAYCRIVWRTWTTTRSSAKGDLEIQILSSSFSRVQVRWVKHSRWVPGGTWDESYVTWSRVTSWRSNAAWHQARAWQGQNLLVNSVICLIWSRHTLHEPNGQLYGNKWIGLNKRYVLQSAQGSVSPCFLLKCVSFWQKVQKMNYAEVLRVFMCNEDRYRIHRRPPLLLFWVICSQFTLSYSFPWLQIYLSIAFIL